MKSQFHGNSITSLSKVLRDRYPADKAISMAIEIMTKMQERMVTLDDKDCVSCAKRRRLAKAAAKRQRERAKANKADKTG